MKSFVYKIIQTENGDKWWIIFKIWNFHLVYLIICAKTAYDMPVILDTYVFDLVKNVNLLKIFFLFLMLCTLFRY